MTNPNSHPATATTTANAVMAGMPHPSTNVFVAPTHPHVLHSTTAATAAPAAPATAVAAAAAAASVVVESEEKRARRLARNRESARQSRRRKKERLANLGNKVQTLHNKLDVVRRAKLNGMNAALLRKRNERIQNQLGLLQQQPSPPQQQQTTTTTTTGTSCAADGGEQQQQQQQQQQQFLQDLFMETGPNSSTKQAALLFQHTALRQLLLPAYQEFILWLLRQEDAFYTTGKEQKAKMSVDPSKTTPGRISSKQVGEDVTNQWTVLEESNSVSTLPPLPSLPPREVGGDDANPANAAAAAAGTRRCWGNDYLRMWPLVCYELQISVEQEEKLLQWVKRSQQHEALEEERARMADAHKLLHTLRKGVAGQSRAVDWRGGHTLLGTLKPDQCLRYLDWFERNKARCREKLQEQQQQRRQQQQQQQQQQEEGQEHPREEDEDSAAAPAEQSTTPKQQDENNPAEDRMEDDTKDHDKRAKSVQSAQDLAEICRRLQEVVHLHAQG